jgi:hypothetical protein
MSPPPDTIRIVSNIREYARFKPKTLELPYNIENTLTTVLGPSKVIFNGSCGSDGVLILKFESFARIEDDY